MIEITGFANRLGDLPPPPTKFLPSAPGRIELPFAEAGEICIWSRLGEKSVQF